MRYKDTPKAEAMLAHLQACQAGTQTVEQYCGQHGIKKSSYYYWHKRLTKHCDPTGFVALSINDNHGTDVIVSFPNGINISFSGNISAAVLKELACCI